MTVTTRFAPSPTGRLHVGNIRAALHNWLFARQRGGRFLLRLDDTDTERSTEAFARSIRDDLDWLGLTPDDVSRQSNHSLRYEARFEELRDKGRIYPAYESAQELELKRKILAGRGLPPVYDRAALALSDSDRAALEAEGRRPHWRFRLDHEAPIEWTDLIRGPVRFDPKLLSDPVIRREDGSWLYMLPSVIDDIDMGVTHVVRGEDHVTNTGLQLQMFAALGATPPAFAHEALLTGSEGKLSKRLGSLGVDTFREDGIEPVAVLAERIAQFDFGRFGRAPARFDPEELAGVNRRIVHMLDFGAVAERLPADMDETAWLAIRPNVDRVAQAAEWWKVVEGPIPTPELSGEDRAYLAEAARVAASMEWSADPWHGLTATLKELTGRKGKALFLPLRLALTGLDHGPDMAALLPLIGRNRALERLGAA
jgi:glutamyl-tRNA synthetase